MFYKSNLTTSNTADAVTTFGGYDHREQIDEASWYDMKNMSSKNYPALSPRDIRKIYDTDKKIVGATMVDGKVIIFDGESVIYGNKTINVSSVNKNISESLNGTETIGTITEHQTLLAVGAKLVIIPAKIVVNLEDESVDIIEKKYMVAMDAYKNETVLSRRKADLTTATQDDFYYCPCKKDGTEIYAKNVQGTTDEIIQVINDPQDGDYKVAGDDENATWYVYYEATSTWSPIETTYIKIYFKGARFNEIFEEGDAIYFWCLVTRNGKELGIGLTDYMDGSIIQTVEEDYIVIEGLYDNTVDKHRDIGYFYLQTKMPDMDYCCVSNNRLWGCRYGSSRNTNWELVNEIYASKMGQPEKWNYFQGTSIDSYTLSIGDPGPWTGCITYNGYPYFFKENRIYNIYGAYPAAYQLYTYDYRGVQEGSSLSLAVVEGYIFYKSVKDVCVFDGTSVVGISDNFGNNKYKNAVAGVSVGKYYLSMKDKNLLTTPLFVYDMDTGLWEKEDNTRYVQFINNNSGQLYGITSSGDMYGIQGELDDLEDAEDHVDWQVTSGNLGMGYINKKYIKALHIRAKMDTDAYFEVWTSTDDREWQIKQTCRGTGKIETYRIPVRDLRNEQYRIKLVGHEDCIIYALYKETELGATR